MQRVGCRAKPVICRRRIYRTDIGIIIIIIVVGRSVVRAWGGCQNFLSSVRARSNPVFSRSVSTTDGWLRLRLRPPPPPQPAPPPLPTPPSPLPLAQATTTTRRRNRDREVIQRPQTIRRGLFPFPPGGRGGDRVRG